MEQEIKLRIILEKPTAGVDFGLQKGKGNDYETVQKQRSVGKDLTFEFPVKLKLTDNKTTIVSGAFAQGTPDARFFYIDIGTYAGQTESVWGRRLKIPATGISLPMIQSAPGNPELVFETIVPGIGKDGGPNCATVKPFAGWKIKQV